MSHFSHTKNGLIYGPKSNAAAALHRHAFMCAIAEHVPAAVSDLRKLAPLFDQHGSAPPSLSTPLTQAIRRWATGLNLVGLDGRPPHWVVFAAKRALRHVQGSNPFGRFGAPGEFSAVPEVATEISLATSWDPSTETRGAAEDRIVSAVRLRLDEIEAAALKNGSRRLGKNESQHFVWAAKFQCGSVPIAKIARRPEGERTVQLAIAGVLEMIGIARRTDSRGRPRKIRNRK